MASKAKKTAKGKTNGKTTNHKAPSLVAQAVDFMRAEVKHAGGLKNLEFGGRKVILEKAAKRFGLAVPTCATQYQKHIRAAA